MEKLIMEAVTRAAVAAGLPAERVMTESAKDNLTLPRPRVEVQMQPATYKRTGRKLGVTRTETRHITKRELYEVERDGNTIEYDGMTMERVDRPTAECAAALDKAPLPTPLP